MSLANDMLSLRREIDSMHSARMAMMHRLNRFRSDLRKSVARSMSELHRALAKEFSRNRAARQAFNSHNQHNVEGMVDAFCSERNAARRNFMGKRA